MKKVISVILCVAMILCTVSVAFAGEKEIDYTFDSPYADIDWDTYTAYKAQLHCHTTASDGCQTIKDAIEDYYDLDYDIVAITDHGTTNIAWNIAPQTIPIMRELRKDRTGGASCPIVPLTDEEYEAYTNGTAASSKRTHTNGMLDVYGGNELNMATPFADCHLTCYNSDYGQGYAGVFGDYETPSAEVNKDGGYTMLAHVGEYVYIDKDSADHVGQPVDEYYVNKFARIFLDNVGSSLGMGINSATDAHTRCDRILYDSILLKTIPNGVTPWAFCFSDSHSETSINDAYTYIYMDELTEEAMYDSMLNGRMFAVSHYSNGYELNGMAEYEILGEDGEYRAYEDANCDKVDWQSNATPMVTKVEIDDENDVIKVWGENFDSITWVSAGNVILRERYITSNYAEIDLDSTELLNDPYMFVRFYITGPKGICYSEPITIYRDGEKFAAVTVPETHDVSTVLRTTVTLLDWVFLKWNVVVWMFKYFAMGYDPIEQNIDSIKDIFTYGCN